MTILFHPKYINKIFIGGGGTEHGKEVCKVIILLILEEEGSIFVVS